MTNGTQLQPDGAIAPVPVDPAGDSGPPAGAAPAVTSLPRPRQPLTVIPRRATGTWAAIARPSDPGRPDATTIGLPAVTRPATGDLPTPRAPRPRRTRLLAGGAALVATATAVAALLWVRDDRPAATPGQAAPVLVGGPSLAGEPSGEVTVPAPPVAPTDSATPEGSGTPDASAEATAAPEATRATPTEQAAQRPDAPPPPAQAGPADRPPAPGRVNAEGRNLALHQPVFASSFDSRFHVPANAVDGRVLTRWSSVASDPQWIAVDLGARWQISKISIVWELANANTYRVELSSDGSSWTPVYQTRNGVGGTVAVPVDDVSARYVRLYGTERAGLFGYSVRELDVR